jgi:hypothetical protein
MLTHKREKTIREVTIECVRSALTPHQLWCVERERGRLETWDDWQLANALDDLNNSSL